MKKIFFLALFAILGMTASYAQSVGFNVKAGAGIANLNGDADGDPSSPTKSVSVPKSAWEATGHSNRPSSSSVKERPAASVRI